MANGDLDDFAEIVHPEASNREAIAEPPASRGRGPTAIHATAVWLRHAFDELAWEVHDVVAEGDMVCRRRFFPPTGKRFAATQTHWYRVAECGCAALFTGPAGPSENGAGNLSPRLAAHGGQNSA